MANSFLKNVTKVMLNYHTKISYKRSVSAIRTFSLKPEIEPSNVDSIEDVRRNLQKMMGVQTGYSPLGSIRTHLLEYVPKSQKDLPARSMQDSFCSAVIPLSKDKVLQDKYMTFLGRVRLGRLMEDMDIFAVWVSMKHILLPNLPPGTSIPHTLVTVLVDKIDFTEFTPKPDADIRLSGHVSWVGKSSIEVVVWLEQMSHGHWNKVTRALFLMAARDPTNTHAAFINPLEPKSEEEKIIFAGGENRKKQRIEIQKQSLLKVVPNTEEQHVIHNLFLRTVDSQDPSTTTKNLPPGTIWMEKAILSNLIFSHPENRNLHNKVFGGFLMRHALELSWAAAYLHSKYRPKLEHISDISFHHPVDVSSLIRMHAHVVYTEQQYVQIVVYAEVFDTHSGSHSTSNMFHYTYSIPDKAFHVIPRTYQEAIMYLDGRRKFQHIKSLNTLGR